MSGDICLLAHLNLLVVCPPESDPTLQTLQQYELLGRAGSNPSEKYLSLSPCGSTVLGLDLSAPGLEH